MNENIEILLMLNFQKKKNETKKFTVWFAITFMEAIFAKLLAALCAKEMFRMPGFIQSSHTFIKNSAVAISTAWAKQIVIIWFTYI